MSNNENNPIVEAQMEEDKNNIFKLAHNYFKFSEELKNSDKIIKNLQIISYIKKIKIINVK